MKILIVDDETLVRVGIKSSLQSWGNDYEIVEAADGAQALAIAREIRPDLVMTDIKMPVMDGIELIRNAIASNIDTTFIVLSCFSDYEYVREALKLGARDYILKHKINLEDIRDLVEGLERELATAKPDAGKFNRPSTTGQSTKQELLPQLLTSGEQLPELLKELRNRHARLEGNRYILALLGLDQVAELKSHYPDQDLLLINSILNLADETFTNFGTGEIAYLQNYQFLIVLALPTHSEQEAITTAIKIMSEVQNTLLKYLEVSATVSIAHVANFKNWSSAWQRVKQQYQLKFFKGKGALILPADPLPLNHQANLLPSYFEDLISGECLDPVAKIRRSIEKLYRDYSLTENALKDYICDFLINTLSQLSKTRSKEPEEIRPNHGCYNQIMTRIMKTETLEELQEVLSDYLLQYFGESEPAVWINSPAVLEVVRILKSEYREEISLEQVAERINANPSYLSRAFKKETGKNFVEYLTETRLGEAQKYLETTDLPISEIAGRVGYSNQQYFSKVFKKCYGVAPWDYRMEYLNSDLRRESRDASKTEN
jgi:two-component system response regulator YesN